MTLHAIKSRDQVTGEWISRCGLRGRRDLRPLPWANPGASARYGAGTSYFEVTGSEDRIDCPGCRLQLSEGQRTVLRLLYQLGGRAVYREGSLDWNDVVKPPVVWAEPSDMEPLMAMLLVYRRRPYVTLSPRGQGLAKTYPEVEP